MYSSYMKIKPNKPFYKKRYNNNNINLTFLLDILITL